jgi:hypothetical protein
MVPTYLLGVLVATSRYLLTLFLFGKRAGMRRGEQALVDKYIPNLSPGSTHPATLLSAGVAFRDLSPAFSRLIGFLQRFVQSTASARRKK